MARRRRITGSKLLGAELRRLRGARSLEEIARLSRTPPHADRIEPIAYSTLSMLERGVTMPSAQSLITLSVIYHVPVQQLMDLIALERHQLRGLAPLSEPAELEHRVASDLRRGRYAEAFSGSLRCLELLRERAEARGEAPDRDHVAGARLLSGLALWKLGWLSQAAGTFRDVVDDLDVVAELRGWAYQNLVEVERVLGRHASARAYAREGLELAETGGSGRLKGTFHATLANLERDLAERARDPGERAERLEAALAHHAAARTLARAVGDRFLLANDVLNEGVTHATAGDAERARRCLLEGLTAAEGEGYARLQAFARLELGKLALAEGRAGEARRFLRRSEREAEALEANDLAFLSSFYLLKAARELGEDAGDALRRCQGLRAFLEGRHPEVDELEAFAPDRAEATS